jgi:hypothetical protein
MIRALLVAALALAGCSGPVPVYLSSSETPGSPLTDPPARERELLDEAFGFWGYEYELVGPGAAVASYGAIEVSLVDLDDAPVDGYHAPPTPCRRAVWSSFDPEVLAHELGHAFGLEHVDDRENLMHPRRPRGQEVTDAQWDDSGAAVGRFLACVDGA